MAAGRSRGFDVVHVFRYHEREMRRATRALREAGVAIVWDNDDDFSDPTSCVRSRRTRRSSRCCSWPMS